MKNPERTQPALFSSNGGDRVPDHGASPSQGPLGIESHLWASADKLRGAVDPTKYRYVLLALIFLRRVLGTSEPPAGLKVPDELSWDSYFAGSDADTINAALANAVDRLESCNPELSGILPSVFAETTIDGRRLLELVDLVSSLTTDGGYRDFLGRTYEYFLGRFASLEGRSGGEFYTPTSIVRLLVEMLEPLDGVVYDPCCGSGGMFVQSARFLEAHGGDAPSQRLVGQELNPGTWRLAIMNLLLHDLSIDLGEGPADTFHDDQHQNMEADYVLANPPFNMSDWGREGLLTDPRWRYGLPPSGNANLAWIQHIVARLASNGRAGIVLANGTLDSDNQEETQIRAGLVEEGWVECMVALPGQLFYSTTIPVTLWFLSGPDAVQPEGTKGTVLFIDGTSLGNKVTRTHRELSDDDIRRICSTYLGWRRGEQVRDEPGFSRVVPREEIRETSYSLAPARYVVPVVDGPTDERSLREMILDYGQLAKEMADIDSRVLELLSEVEA